MSSLWSSLKGKEQPATDLVNDDVVAVEDPVRGAPIRAGGPRMAFKPMNSVQVEEMLHLANGNAAVVVERTTFEPVDRVPMEYVEDDFMDLITPDPPPMPKSGGAAAGRPRQYVNNAARQQAYRDRHKRRA